MPAITHLEIETRLGKISVPHMRCPDFDLPDCVPDSVKRRMPRISALFFAAVFEAVEDAFGSEMTFLKENPERVGIIVGTAFGCLTTAIAYDRRLVQDGPVGASPTLFTGSIQNAIAAHLSIALGIQGPTSTVTTMELTTVNAVRMAEDWLDQDIVDHVVVAVGDEISEIHLYAMAHKIHAMPWVLMGEGTVSFVLSKTNSRVDHKPYGKIERQTHQSPELPLVDRHLLSPWDGDRQVKAFHNLSRRSIDTKPIREPLTHLDLYGHSPLGLAFELAIGTCLVQSDRQPTACAQIGKNNLVDSIVLG